MRAFVLLLYYAVFSHLPMHPFPGGRLFNWFRFWAVSKVLRKCGEGVLVKNKCYFGEGSRLTIGNNSQLGQNAHLVGDIVIGNDVLMGPDVVMMATSHRHERIDIPMIQQGEAAEKEIRLGNDIWVGTRVIILPGVRIGDGCIIAAGAVVSTSFPPFSIVGGVPAKLLKVRKDVRPDIF